MIIVNITITVLNIQVHLAEPLGFAEHTLGIAGIDD
jgi:hypothetical protein